MRLNRLGFRAGIAYFFGQLGYFFASLCARLFVAVLGIALAISAYYILVAVFAEYFVAP